jgi:hypothetical protein
MGCPVPVVERSRGNLLELTDPDGNSHPNLTPANEGDLRTELQVDCDLSCGIEAQRTAASVAQYVARAIIGSGG